MPDTIICCEPTCERICGALEKALSAEHKRTSVFGDGNTSGQIIDIIKRHLMENRINLKKGFFDL